MKSQIILFLFVLGLISCNVDSDSDPIFPNDFPELRILESRVFEQTGQVDMLFEVVADGTVELPITFTYIVTGKTATPDEDFVVGTGSSTIGVGARSVFVPIKILDDDLNEVDEKLTLTLTDASNSTISVAEAIGIIQDNDDPANFDADGYFTNNDFYGYSLKWQDEFEGTELDQSVYNYELENGCPDLCGWGNEELQWYTDLPNNVMLADGKLTITATQQGPASYNSGRIQTKDKKEFQYGRIDVRARLPMGQGIWPAIWMLGENIDEVGWPACGEIDIMEMVGHRPNVVYGTAHWGAEGAPGSTFQGSEFANDENFIEQFHVFSLVWEEDELVWYVDETRFHSITPGDMQGGEYRFNNSFFFIFNVAVGGIFPGNPDETTEFPQKMEIDYIRVFQ